MTVRRNSGQPVGRPRRHMLALEPRLLFDGAAAATADQQQDDQQARADAAAQSASDTPEAPLLPADGAASAPAPRELLVVDTRIPDWPALVERARPNVQVLLLDASADPLAQITAAIGDRPIDGIHLLAHGDPGALRLGGLVLDRQGVDRYALELAQLGAGLTPDGDILLYGCDTGKGEAGRLLIEALARVTGADIAASTDLTGATRLHDLEAGAGKKGKGVFLQPALGGKADDQRRAHEADSIVAMRSSQKATPRPGTEWPSRSNNRS